MRSLQVQQQTAIVQVLSNMDAKPTKTRDLKTGLMQELLTGRIRLIVASKGEQNDPKF